MKKETLDSLLKYKADVIVFSEQDFKIVQNTLKKY